MQQDDTMVTMTSWWIDTMKNRRVAPRGGTKMPCNSAKTCEVKTERQLKSKRVQLLHISGSPSAF